jgi:hypothetical protein
MLAVTDQCKVLQDDPDAEQEVIRAMLFADRVWT